MPDTMVKPAISREGRVKEVEYGLGFIRLVSLEEHRKLPSCKRFLDISRNFMLLRFYANFSARCRGNKTINAKI